MGALEIKIYAVGMLSTNCYFLIHKDTRQMVIVDPGADAERLKVKIQEQKLKPQAILLTHAHGDHILGVEYLKNAYQIPVYIHEVDSEPLLYADRNLSLMFGSETSIKADVCLKDQQELQLAGFEIRVLFTPGHTAGGCCYYLPQEQVLMSGDTLFYDSIGRTDFPGGSMSELLRSVRDKLMTLPDETDVYPGHGEPTTIGREREYNAWIR